MPVELLKQLLREPSVTPHDGACQDIIAARLEALGCTIERMDEADTRNLWVTHGQGSPVIAFAGHTDVVPTGEEALWTHPPFAATEVDGVIYGRGAVDMKTGVATAVTAMEALIQEQPHHPGTLALLITSDEEGSALHGTQAVLKRLAARGERIDYALVCEPTGRERLGDTARRGRRGSLTLDLKIEGKQGHVAHPQNIINPIHALGRVIAALSATVWDRGNAYFPPSNMECSNIQAGTGADNVVPQSASLTVNWRFNTEHEVADLQARVEEIVSREALPARAFLQWRLSGLPFVTENKLLEQAISDACLKHTGLRPEFNCGGGTSDARFIAQYGTAVMELGVMNQTLHQINEHVRIEEVYLSHDIYQDIVRQLWQAL